MYQICKMNRYQNFSVRIRPLTDLLIKYVSDLKKNKTENLENLRSEFFKIFDELEGPEENFHHIQNIRDKVVRDMERNYFDDIEATSYARDLVAYGYK
jgi:hypothetical protein